MKNIVIYHTADLDGKLSGSICKYFLEKQGESVSILPWDYHFELTEDIEKTINSYDRIFIVDLSIDKILFDKNTRPKIIWIDHHVSAIKKHDTRIRGLRIDGVAASRLCYQYFTNDIYSMLDLKDFEDRIVDEPEFVALAGEYDVFFEREDDFHFCINFAVGHWSFDEIESYFISTKDYSLSRCPLEESPIYEEIKLGEAVLEYVRSIGLKSTKYTFTKNGLKFIAINTNVYSSLIFDKLPKIYDVLCVFSFIGLDLSKVKVSFYTEKPHLINCSEIAANYNGGGHRGAAGCIMQLSTFNNEFLNT